MKNKKKKTKHNLMLPKIRSQMYCYFEVMVWYSYNKMDVVISADFILVS